MKKLVIIFSLLFITTSCMPPFYTFQTLPTSGKDGQDGIGCISERVEDGVLVTCGNNTPVLVKDGEKGDKGDQGPSGIPGTACVAVPTIGGVNLLCGSNPAVFLRDGTDGMTGATGDKGDKGDTGDAGTSCTVTTLFPTVSAPLGGALVACGITSAIVLNGANGANGSQAQTVVESIDPCGPSGGYDEVLMRTAKGDLVAMFVENSSALTARLSFLKDGVGYQTTDSQHCNFTITSGPPVTIGSSGERTITWTSPISGSKSWPTY